MKARALVATAASLALLAPAGIAVRSLGGAGTDAAPKDPEQAARQAYGQLPVSFEANQGQTDSHVRFLSRGPGSTLFLTPNEAVLSLTTAKRDRAGTTSAPTTSAVVRMEFLGANIDAPIAGRDKLPGSVNHFSGADPAAWRTGIPTFGKVAYSGVYPGIDLEYYGKQGSTEYDFVVAPGADPGAIRLGIEGAQSLSLDAKGDLVIQTQVGEVRQHRPVLYQQVGGKKQSVAGRFVLSGNTVSFDVGRYDRDLPLVIDPVISYSTWLGGSGADVGYGLAVAPDGSAFIAGDTGSVNFPTKGSVSCGGTPPVTSSYQCNLPANDAFITKLNPAGSALVYSTYLGGGRDDYAQRLAVDADGNAYLTGGTNSYEDPATTATEAGFPTTANAFDGTCGSDGLCDAPQHPAGSPCPTGSTCPTAGLWDAFMAKLNASGDTLLYSTFLGGSSTEANDVAGALASHVGIAVRGTTAYVAGSTTSPDFPTTAGAAQPTCGTAAEAGCDRRAADGYLAVIDTAQSGASSLVYSSYVGGSGHDLLRSVAVDDQGDAYLTGTTYGYDDGAGGTTNNFPTTSSAFQPSYQGGAADAFAVKVDPDGPNVVRWATYLGGGGYDHGWGIAVHNLNQEAIVTGWTNSGDDPATPAADGPAPYFPTTNLAYDDTFGGRAASSDVTNTFYDGDGYVTRLNPGGTGLAYSTFLGGTFMDVATAVTVDLTGAAYITGYTTCQNDNGGVPLPPGSTPPAQCDGTFPMQNAIDDDMDGSYIGFENHNAPTDVFVAKLSPGGNSLLFSTYLGGRDFDRGFAVAVRDRNANGQLMIPEIYVTGRMASDNYPTTAGSFKPTKPAGNGNRDVAVTKIAGL